METDLFKIKDSRKLQLSRFTVTEDDLEIDGKPARYSFIEIKPGICVIVKTDDKFAVLKEYRYPIKAWSYEFAAGVIDEGEEPKDAALREVEEETGFVADRIVSLGEFYPSFGVTNEIIYLFYAECSGQKAAQQEYTEFITYDLMSEAEVDELIKNGEFKHGAGLAAWLRYKLS